MIQDSENRAAWGHLTTVMRADWFSRRWVIQEIAHSRVATIHCGEHSLHWDDFVDAVSLLVEKIELLRARYADEVFEDVEATSAAILVKTLDNVFTKSDNAQDYGAVSSHLLDAETLVSTLFAFQATYPRDIIHAVLSLSRDLPFLHEDWQTLHHDQLLRFRDFNLKQLHSALGPCIAKKNMVEEDIRMDRDTRREVEFRLVEIRRLRERGLDATPSDIGGPDTEGGELGHTISPMHESDLKTLYRSFEEQKALRGQYWVKIRQIELPIARASKDVEEYRVGLLPDYTVSTRDVFIAFVTRTIYQTKSLDIICRHWAPELTGPDARAGQLPSWVSSRSRAPFGPPGKARGRQNGENLVAYLPQDQRRRYAASVTTAARIRMLVDPSIVDERANDSPPSAETPEQIDDPRVTQASEISAGSIAEPEHTPVGNKEAGDFNGKLSGTEWKELAISGHCHRHRHG